MCLCTCLLCTCPFVQLFPQSQDSGVTHNSWSAVLSARTSGAGHVSCVQQMMAGFKYCSIKTIYLAGWVGMIKMHHMIKFQDGARLERCWQCTRITLEKITDSLTVRYKAMFLPSENDVCIMQVVRQIWSSKRLGLFKILHEKHIIPLNSICDIIGLAFVFTSKIRLHVQTYECICGQTRYACCQTFLCAPLSCAWSLPLAAHAPPYLCWPSWRWKSFGPHTDS